MFSRLVKKTEQNLSYMVYVAWRQQNAKQKQMKEENIKEWERERKKTQHYSWVLVRCAAFSNLFPLAHERALDIKKPKQNLMLSIKRKRKQKNNNINTLQLH